MHKIMIAGVVLALAGFCVPDAKAQSVCYESSIVSPVPFLGVDGEMSRGFGQNEQRFGRLERRLDALDAGLTGIRTELTASTSQILQAIKGEP